jgi:hypothetical protein
LPELVQEPSQQGVIPAKAGIQFFFNVLKRAPSEQPVVRAKAGIGLPGQIAEELDSSLRWNDEQKFFQAFA